jgi:mersacidin/lichenicidin family type 2 lantibiotic
MSNLNIIQAWKDPDYRRSLTEAQRAQLPAHPSGAIEFQDHSLEQANSLNHGCSPCHRCNSGG